MDEDNTLERHMEALLRELELGLWEMGDDILCASVVGGLRELAARRGIGAVLTWLRAIGPALEEGCAAAEAAESIKH